MIKFVQQHALRVCFLVKNYIFANCVVSPTLIIVNLSLLDPSHVQYNEITEFCSSTAVSVFAYEGMCIEFCLSSPKYMLFHYSFLVKQCLLNTN